MMRLKRHFVRTTALVVVTISLLTAIPAVGMADGVGMNLASYSEMPAAPIKLVGFGDKITDAEAMLASLAVSSERIAPDKLASVRIGTDIVFINVAGLNWTTPMQSTSVNDTSRSVVLSNQTDAQNSLRDLILNGVPVLIFANDPGLFQAALADLKMPMVFQDNSTIYGYKYDPELGAAAGFCVGRPNPTIQPDEIYAAYAWGVNRLDGLAKEMPSYASNPSLLDATRTSPWWQFDWTLSSYNNYGSYGQLNVNTVYSVLMNDGDSTYNYYAVDFGLQNIPGPGGLGQWYNADMWVNTGNINDRGDIHPTRWLQDYQPTSTVSGGTLTVSFNQNGAQISWSYPINDVTVHDQSNYGTGVAGWWHDVNEVASIGRQTYTIHPGMIVKTQQAWGGYYQVMHDTYRIQWYQTYIWPFGGWQNRQVVLSGQIPAPTS
jgi:hypothetical protein